MTAVVYPRVGGVVGTPNYIGSMTLANRPAASAALTGCMALLTDVGATGGSYWYCDGTYWRPIARQRLYALNSQQSVVSGGTISILNSGITIPAGAMGVNGGVIVTLETVSTSTASTGHTLSMSLTGTNADDTSGSTTIMTLTHSGSVTSHRGQILVCNRNSALSQKVSAITLTNYASYTPTATITKKSTLAQTLNLTLTATTGGASCESISVEVF